MRKIHPQILFLALSLTALSFGSAGCRSENSSQDAAARSGAAQQTRTASGGEADAAFEWLDKAVHYNDPGLAEIANEPLFGNIRSDPRWLPFLQRVGKSPDQLASIEFNVPLPGRR